MNDPIVPKFSVTLKGMVDKDKGKVTGVDSICCVRRSDRRTVPRALWELTSRCNLRCHFCHRRTDPVRELSTSEVEVVGTKLWAAGVRGIVLTGGEPLLRPDLMPVVTSLRRIEFDVHVCTNGTLLNKDVAEALRRHISGITFSIDAADPAVHDTLRGRLGSHKLTAAAVKLCVELGLSVNATAMVCPTTVGRIEETVEFVVTLGVKSITLLGEIPIRRGLERISFLKTEANAELRCRIDGLREHFPDIEINTKELLTDSTYRNCEAGRYVLGVDSAGMLVPCLLHQNIEGLSLLDAEIDTVKNTLERWRSEVPKQNFRGDEEGLCPGSRVLPKL